ncbi:hypothetical protein ACIBF5_15820 [Micromonospora sp. NPDC050417]|uniref:hypothetical protein n=1 Tax=Micromonospora sp. NPDC050417 TaxID=3364280 RepID=UPI0037B1FEF4
MADADPVTLGELGRRVDRVDVEMRNGFQQLREELRGLTFVPAAVYAADRSGDHERMRRLEGDLKEEITAREEAEKVAGQRAWQSRLSLTLAIVGLPISIVGSIVVAIIHAQINP